MLHDFQMWLVTSVDRHSVIAEMMQSKWGWPIAESLHFMGLCLLVGAIGTFDLRLLGVGKRVPIAIVHRFIPWGIAGFLINATTGLCFLLTYPDQYVLNSSFHYKLLFLTIAGLNAGTFYLTASRWAFDTSATLEAPRRARVIAAVSLLAWLGVIIGGRLLTFYRPGPCEGPQTALLLACYPRLPR